MGCFKGKKTLFLEELTIRIETINKIYFLHNPYPNGHKTVTSHRSGRIDEDESI